MGLSQSSPSNEEELPSLSNVLDVDGEVDWNVVRQILQQEPEQACMYAHGGVEDSLCLVALKRAAPLDVVELFVDADEDALTSTSNGSSVLHVARNHADTVDLLLKLSPSLAKATDRDGRLALHLCNNAQAARYILQSYPQGLTQRSRQSGNLPLHHALLQEQDDSITAEPELLRVLASSSSKQQHTSPSHIITSRNKRGQTPVQLLVRQLDRVEPGDNNTLFDELWKVLLEWVKSLEPKKLELHALIELGCCHSQNLMKKALQEFGHQTSQWDVLGRTPLHVAAATAGTTTTEALEALLESNPNAPRMTDREGRLPIDVAAESPNTPLRSLALLMKGEPRAIDTRDLRDGNYPFVSAALAGQHTSINNTYFLLRAKPHVLSYFHLP